MDDRSISKKLNKGYNAKDSGIVFSLAVIALVVGSLLVEATGLGEGFGEYLPSAVIQTAFLAVALLYTLRVKRSLRPLMFKLPKLGRDNKIILSSIALGLTMMFAFLIPASLFQEFLYSIGYKSIDSLLPLDTPLDLINALFFVAVMPGICEELVFRGVILQGLRKFGDIFAVLVSAILFMLIHANPEQTIFPFLSGIILGVVFIKSGNLVYPMIIHFLNNALVIVLEYIKFDTLTIWGVDAFIIFMIAGIAVFAVVFYFIVKGRSVLPCKDASFKVIKYDNVGMIRTYGVAMRPNPNTYLRYVRSVLSGNKGVDKSNLNYGYMDTHMPQENSALDGSKEGYRDSYKIGGASNNHSYNCKNDKGVGDYDNYADTGGDIGEPEYMFYQKKSAYYLFTDDAEYEHTPPLFLDVTNDGYYNPGKTKRRGFLAFAITGIIICVILWISVFAMSLA